MQYQSITRAHAPPDLVRASLQGFLSSPVTLVLLFTLVVLALNPVGYKGGGTDDYQYLQAARCAAEQGFCLPVDHWWRRFAIVIPAGMMIRLFGESEAALGVFPLLYGIGSITLFVGLVQRQFGRRAALIAGLVFAGTPVIGERLLEVNIDTAELICLLGALFCLQAAHRGGQGWLFPAAGALFGLAILARPSQLALVPIFAAAFWLLPEWRRRAPAFGLGLLAPILVESAVYAVWAGDALLSWKLSAAHTRIPSTELAKSVDLAQSPLFNIAFIDGWRPAMGLSVHWTVDGLLNLLAHPVIGVSLVAALVLLILDARRIQAGPHRQLILFLVTASAAFFGTLVYAFAVDPKPRMFLPVLAVACAIFGLLAADRLRRRDYLLVVTCLTLLVAKGVAVSLSPLGIGPVAATAREWVRAEPDAIALTPLTFTLFTLTPELRHLPVGDDVRPKLLVTSGGNCAQATKGRYRDWQVLRQARFWRQAGPFVELMSRVGMVPPRGVTALCLIERPASGGFSANQAVSLRP